MINTSTCLFLFREDLKNHSKNKYKFDSKFFKSLSLIDFSDTSLLNKSIEELRKKDFIIYLDESNVAKCLYRKDITISKGYLEIIW